MCPAKRESAVDTVDTLSSAEAAAPEYHGIVSSLYAPSTMPPDCPSAEQMFKNALTTLPMGAGKASWVAA